MVRSLPDGAAMAELQRQPRCSKAWPTPPAAGVVPPGRRRGGSSGAAGATGLSASALSQHLAVLRAMKIVATRREAQAIHYRVVEGPALVCCRPCTLPTAAGREVECQPACSAGCTTVSSRSTGAGAARSPPAPG